MHVSRESFGVTIQYYSSSYDFETAFVKAYGDFRCKHAAYPLGAVEGIRSGYPRGIKEYISVRRPTNIQR